MKRRTSLATAVFVTGLALLVVAEQTFQRAAAQGQAASMVEAPKFEVDPTFPKPLPNGWLMGNVIGIAADAQDLSVVRVHILRILACLAIAYGHEQVAFVRQ